MKLEDFNTDIAKKVMALWKEHLGVYDKKYFRHPELLVRNVIESMYSLYYFEDRIGSRFSEDSKLHATAFDDLIFECNVQSHTIMDAAIRKQAENAEEVFNKSVKEYLMKL